MCACVRRVGKEEGWGVGGVKTWMMQLVLFGVCIMGTGDGLRCKCRCNESGVDATIAPCPCDLLCGGCLGVQASAEPPYVVACPPMDTRLRKDDYVFILSQSTPYGAWSQKLL